MFTDEGLLLKEAVIFQIFDTREYVFLGQTKFGLSEPREN